MDLWYCVAKWSRRQTSEFEGMSSSLAESGRVVFFRYIFYSSFFCMSFRFVFLFFSFQEEISSCLFVLFFLLLL